MQTRSVLASLTAADNVNGRYDGVLRKQFYIRCENLLPALSDPQPPQSQRLDKAHPDRDTSPETDYAF